jgi:KAP-like P-loop domain-containing protein
VGKNGKPLLFFVDELDRCRPTYAVALLERMKHIFDVEGIVFVLAIDKGQIGHSLKAVYGSGLEVDGYLRRFIDLEYRIPDPPREKYAGYLFKQFDIASLVAKSIPARFVRQVDGTIGMFGWLADTYNLSLRAQEQCIALLGVILMVTSPGENLDPVPLIALLTIKQGIRMDMPISYPGKSE